MSSLFEQAIINALNSVNPQKVLEDKVANAIIRAGFDLVSFNKTVGLNGEIGEIDMETSNAIIEVGKSDSSSTNLYAGKSSA
ncbi:MAG: hypothetical protein V7K48_09110 [Nostoc sp.]|uniref:hypothetical protein n=1 Tax=Nostoc sp. TaxID=1180 RepID=UPI002FF7D467